MRTPTGLLFFILLGCVVAATAAQPDTAVDRASARLTVRRLDQPTRDIAPVQKAVPPMQLILDDGTREADVGFTNVAAYQFLWFNEFDPPVPGETVVLEEIRVLFPPGPEITPGAAVQLVVLRDDDGDPGSGAELIITVDEVIQAADGSTFSVYPLFPSVELSGSDYLLIGVINRFVVSGVSPPSRPAALDTTSSAGRSWVAVWTTDPPQQPTLPSDDVFSLIDVIQPGNWMIRAQVRQLPALPDLSLAGVVVLVVLLTAAGAAVLRGH